MTKRLDDLVRELKDELDVTRRENEQLEERIRGADSRAKNAEIAAAEAERKLRITADQLNRLQDLKNQEFQTLVSQLFEVPSRKAARLTVVSAIASIILGLYATVFAAVDSSEKMERSLAEMHLEWSEALQHLSDSLTVELRSGQLKIAQEYQEAEMRTASRLELLASGDPRVQQIVTLLQRHRSEFSNFSTENDLRLAYKMRLVPNLPATDHRFFLIAFREAGLSEIAPDSVASLAKWDSELAYIYHRMLQETRAKPAETSPLPQFVRLGSYRRSDDETDYKAFSFSGQRSYGLVASAAQHQLTSVCNQIKRNGGTDYRCNR